jgi:putative membrane protein
MLRWLEERSSHQRQEEIVMISANRLWLAGLAGLFAGGIAMAADQPSTADVLGKIHHANLHEIHMGKMAVNHALSADVKAFGKALMTDHAMADKKVLQLAKDENVSLTAGAPVPDTHLGREFTGAAFDDAFAKEMLADHEKDIADVTAARDATTDAKLKALLTDLLPVLKKHEDTAQKLVDKAAKHST